MKQTNRRTFLQATMGWVAGWSTASARAQASTRAEVAADRPADAARQPARRAGALARRPHGQAGQGSRQRASTVPGAAGAIAADAVLAATRAAGTLLLGGLDHVAYSHVNSNRRALDPFVDFVPVGAVNRDTWVVATGAEQRAEKLPELVQAASVRRADQLRHIGRGRDGTPAQRPALQSDRPRGAARSLQGQLPARPNRRTHPLRHRTDAGGVGPDQGRSSACPRDIDRRRISVLDAVPSIRELGWPEQVFYGGLFLFAPAALSAHQERLNGWLAETLRQPDIAMRYHDAAIEPTPLNVEETRHAITQRLRLLDAMRIAVLGRSR